MIVLLQFTWHQCSSFVVIVYPDAKVCLSVFWKPLEYTHRAELLLALQLCFDLFLLFSSPQLNWLQCPAWRWQGESPPPPYSSVSSCQEMFQTHEILFKNFLTHVKRLCQLIDCNVNSVLHHLPIFFKRKNSMGEVERWCGEVRGWGKGNVNLLGGFVSVDNCIDDTLASVSASLTLSLSSLWHTTPWKWSLATERSKV